MKNKMIRLFMVVVSFGLMGFGCTNSSEAEQQEAVEWYYNVGPRFMTTITKKALQEVESMEYFIPKEQIARIESYKSVNIIVIENEMQSAKRSLGLSKDLNDHQINMLRSFSSSTNFNIRAEFVQRNDESGELEHRFHSPHITVVPEKEAEFVDGKDALMEYIIENCERETSTIVENKFQPGNVYFTVTETGTISNVRLKLSSGFNYIDEFMVNLITNLPGEWKPAENEDGEKVEQELVFAFGAGDC